MKRILFLLVVIFSFAEFEAQEDTILAQEHHKKAGQYADESKKYYLIAGACFVFAILARALNKYANKEDRTEESYKER